MKYFFLLFLLSSTALATQPLPADSYSCDADVTLDGQHIHKNYRFIVPRQFATVNGSQREVSLSDQVAMPLRDDASVQFSVDIELVRTTDQVFESCQISVELDQDGKARWASHPVDLFVPIPVVNGEAQIHGQSYKLYSPVTGEEVGNFDCKWSGSLPIE